MAKKRMTNPKKIRKKGKTRSKKEKKEKNGKEKDLCKRERVSFLSRS